MSMSKKIFGIIGILIVLALLITGIGLYGLERLTSAIHEYSRITARTTLLADVSQIAQDLSLTEKDLIIENDDQKMRELIESDDFRGGNAKIKEIVGKLQALTTEASPPQERDFPAKLEKYWKDFDDATEVVAALSLKNTSKRALEESDYNYTIWDEYNAVLQPIYQDVLKK